MQIAIQFNSNISMEMQPIYKIEDILPDDIFYIVSNSEVGENFHKLEHECNDISAYRKAENEYRTLLASVLSDSRFHNRYIN